MNRNKIEKLVSILQAHLDGKEIEFYSSTLNQWKTSSMNSIATLTSNIDNYRIKPEPKYRPFKDAEECWQEMQKHQPFGWLKMKDTESGYYILKCIANQVVIGLNETPFSYKKVFEDYIFADGAMFGVKVEE